MFVRHAPIIRGCRCPWIHPETAATNFTTRAIGDSDENKWSDLMQLIQFHDKDGLACLVRADSFGLADIHPGASESDPAKVQIHLNSPTYSAALSLNFDSLYYAKWFLAELGAELGNGKTVIIDALQHAKAKKAPQDFYNW